MLVNTPRRNDIEVAFLKNGDENPRFLFFLTIRFKNERPLLEGLFEVFRNFTIFRGSGGIRTG